MASLAEPRDLPILCDLYHTGGEPFQTRQDKPFGKRGASHTDVFRNNGGGLGHATDSCIWCVPGCLMYGLPLRQTCMACQ